MSTPGEIAALFNNLVLSILLVGHQRCEPSWVQTSRIIRHHSVWLIVKGKGVFSIDGSSYTAESGKVFFFSPGMVVERRTDPHNPLEYYFLRFHYTETYEEKEQWITRSFEHSPFPLQGMYSVTNTPPLINSMDQLFTLWKRRGHVTALRQKIVLLEFFLTLLRDFRAQKIAGSTTSAIEYTQDYMVDNYQEPLTLGGLAQMAGISVSHYSRLFKKLVGYSPIDYLAHLRMDRAKELLVLSDYKLKSIANSVGYTDEFYFSRTFKKIVGISPRGYAEKHRTTSRPTDL